MHMTKVISLSDNAYERLKRLKEGKDSFSDVVIRFTEGAHKKIALPKPGALKDMPEMNGIYKEILERRHKGTWRAK